MPLDGTPIPIGKSAPGLETHDAIRIDKQDRRVLDVQTALERIESRLVDFFETIGSTDRMRELQADGEWRRRRRQVSHFEC